MAAPAASSAMFLIEKYRQRHARSASRARDLPAAADSQLLYLNDKIDALLQTLQEGEPEPATGTEDECVICVSARAAMQTWPCGHRVVCRRCFVKTIQTAVRERLLPLRCVICRAKILRLRHSSAPSGGSGRLVSSRSWQGTGNAAVRVPPSASCYSVGARSVPASASLYSVTSAESTLSGVSSTASSSSGTCGEGGGAPRSRKSQHDQDTRRLPPIREFQREFREGRRETSPPPPSATLGCGHQIAPQEPRESVSLLRALRTRVTAPDPAAAAAAAARRARKAAAEERRRQEAAAAAERRREEKARRKADKEARRRAEEDERQARRALKQQAKLQRAARG